MACCVPVDGVLPHCCEIVEGHADLGHPPKRLLMPQLLLKVALQAAQGWVWAAS